MEFKPRTEQEIQDARLWKKGSYDFEIVEAEEKLSKSSNKPMIEMRVKVTNKEGATRILPDYLMPNMAKFRHAADACGLIDRYDSGKVSDAEFRGKKGKLILTIEKDRAKKFPDKNVIVDYVASSAKTKVSDDLSRFTNV